MKTENYTSNGFVAKIEKSKDKRYGATYVTIFLYDERNEDYGVCASLEFIIKHNDNSVVLYSFATDLEYSDRIHSIEFVSILRNVIDLYGLGSLRDKSNVLRILASINTRGRQIELSY